MIALLIGLVASYASSKPRVAFVDEDSLPATSSRRQRFDVGRTIDEAAQNVKLVRLSRTRRSASSPTASRRGRHVPPGFVSTLEQDGAQPELELQVVTRRRSPRACGSRCRRSSTAQPGSSTRTSREPRYVTLILHGGNGTSSAATFTCSGSTGRRSCSRDCRGRRGRRRSRDFVHDARLALAQTDDALRATAASDQARRGARRGGRTWALSAQVQAYALALTITFLGLLLAAGALAAERDENVIGRLVRGLVGLGQLVVAKVALAARSRSRSGWRSRSRSASIIEIGGVTGGEPWRRLPLLVVGLVLAGGGRRRARRAARRARARGAHGLARRGAGRAADRLPRAVPREFVPPAGWLSDALPFAHAVRFFSLGAVRPARGETVAREAAVAGRARRALRRAGPARERVAASV